MGQFRGCLKYILFIFNFALFLLGCSVLAVGIWLKVDESAKHHVTDITEFKNEEYQISYSAYEGDANELTVRLAYALIVLGILAILVVVVGFLGALKESPFLLSLYAVCLFILMVALLVVGVWAHKKRLRGYDPNNEPEFQQTVYQRIHHAITSYNSRDASEKDAARDFIHKIQTKFNCCGGRQAGQEWRHNDINEVCKDRNTRNTGCEAPYHKFVSDEIKAFLDHRYEVIAGISLGVAVCLGLGLVFTILLCCILKRTTVINVN